MHVCHVITRLIVGGAQENTILTCEGLAERGYDVTLIAGPTHGPEGSLVERARAGSYRLIEMPELIRGINPWLDARARRELRAYFAELRPCVVHTHSSKAGIVGRFAAADAAVPLIVHTIHGMSFNRTQPWFVRRAYALLERWAAKRSDWIVTVAEAMIEQSLAAGICQRERMSTVYSGMEVGRYTPNEAWRAAARAEWGATDDRIVVGTIARLFRRKGYEQLIPIMDAAARADERLHFVWIGDGAQREEYLSDLERRGLRERVTLTGLVPPDRVGELLAGIDVLAHTSQWEGLPRVVVQALLMQKPVVAFDIDGAPEVVIDGETGRLIALNDERMFVAALLELAGDAERRSRLGRAGRRHCLDRFDQRVMVDQLDVLYRRLAVRKGLAAGD